MAIRVIMKRKLHKANINFLSIMMGEFDDYMPEDKQCALATGFKFQQHVSVIYCVITGQTLEDRRMEVFLLPKVF